MKTLLRIRLVPNASSNRIDDSEFSTNREAYLKIYVTAIPEKNKANEAMIQILAKYLGIAPSRICISRGAKQRNKIIEIKL